MCSLKEAYAVLDTKRTRTARVDTIQAGGRGLTMGVAVPIKIGELTKPKFRDVCNGCGLCCALELCDVAVQAFPGALAPCPALEWEDGRAWCGMARHPSRHLSLNYAGADPIVAPLYLEAIGADQGCGMED